jgi:F0F1-type ATP synthase assembly protein I
VENPQTAPETRRAVVNDFRRSTGSYELVFAPLLLALIGLALDRWLGTFPYILIAFVVFGFTGAAVKLFYAYRHEMDAHDATAPWRTGADRPPAGAGETAP